MTGSKKRLLSLFDFSGRWSSPYLEAGWDVIQVDIKLGSDILNIDLDTNPFNGPIHGVLAAPPCTDFAGSGAQYWGQKDADGRTDASVALVRKTLDIINYCQPEFWALENPVGRLPKLVPEIGKPWYFQPYWFGDAYTKKTGLWGVFNKPEITDSVEPIKACSQGSWLMKLGGKSERTKELRSMTPMGFAKAFYKANH